MKLEESDEPSELSACVTLDQLIAALSKLRDEHGGAIPVGVHQDYMDYDYNCHNAEFSEAIPDEIVGHVHVGRPKRIVIY